MGMAGHAVFMSNDGNIFAHVHPAGSVSMAAVNIAEGMPGQHNMAGMERQPVSNEVSFPYGFPKPGDYHIFVQISAVVTLKPECFQLTCNDSASR